MPPKLFSAAHADDADCSIIVISPLNSIIQEQLEGYGSSALRVDQTLLNKLNIVASQNEISCKSDSLERITTGQPTYLIGHPEHFLSKPLFKILRSEVWQGKLTHILVDEAHCIDLWGEEFRKDFHELKQQRSIFPYAKVVALTGTATENTQKTIQNELVMKDVKVVKTALSRPNIKLEVKMRPPAMGEDSYDAVIEPYILELRRKGRQFPKTIVYCKLKWCGHAHELCYRPKPESPREDNEDDTCEQYVAQFHAPCTEQMKLHALTNFRDEDGTLRLLFATEAYSMGTDVPDIRRIIHCGVPKSLEIYLQEVGRAGRDGNSAEATLYYNYTDISSNVPGLKPIMKVFCQTDTCRWKFLCEHFNCDFDLSELAHDCCDNCESKSACDDCQLQQALSSC